MTPVYSSAAPDTPMGWFSKAEAWLDAKGKGAWIACMVLGFVFFWPIGLAFLAYMIWSKKMFGSCRKSNRHGRSARHAQMRAYMSGSSGNAVFDAYKADTLARLEREQVEFEEFLQRLREAKDKAEFDQFMDERARAAATSDSDDTQGRADDQGNAPFGQSPA